jgi:hypothetical protein
MSELLNVTVRTNVTDRIAQTSRENPVASLLERRQAKDPGTKTANFLPFTNYGSGLVGVDLQFQSSCGLNYDEI